MERRILRLMLTGIFLLICLDRSLGQISTVDFETAAGYTTSAAESSDGAYDYFIRTDGSDLAADVSFTNSPQGSFFFAAQDIDAAPTPITPPDQGELLLSGINIAGETSLSFSVLLAEDDSNDGNEDWDDTDFVHFDYRIDGGPWQELLWIENDGATFNSAPFIDNDFDGTGDGAEITDAFVDFTVPITGTGNSLDIRVTISLNAGDEDIAFDNLRVLSGIPTTPDVALGSASPIAAATVPAGSGDYPIYQFDLNVTNATAVLDEVTFNLVGSYVAADLQVAPFSLFYSATSNFADASPVGLPAGSTGAGENITFSGLAQAISAGTTAYFWLTADIGAAPTVGNTIQVTAVQNADLTYTNPVNASGTLVDGGIQTFAAPPTWTVGFDAPSGTSAEAGGPVTVNVTMDAAPVANVEVLVADEETGTATDDYTFTNTSLTFTPAEVYPNTKTVTININDDALAEHNETIDLALSITSGSSLLGQTEYVQVVTDDEPLEGLIINEISQGDGGNKEFIELLVVGTPGTTVDLRGWVFDDNNGLFSAGASSDEGIAAGHVAFEDNCTWEKVPVGSIIVFYNADDPNGALPADDPTDADADFTYVIPIETDFGNCLNPTPNNYFDANNALPNTGDESYGGITDDPCWSLISFRNGGDAAQVRRPETPTSEASFFHGMSYGVSVATGELSSDNHPEATELGADALYFTTAGANTVYYFDNTVNDDFRSNGNWVAGTASTDQTPGTPNSPANANFINALRQLPPVASNTSTYTCELRELESRAYLNNADEIFLRVTNQAVIDHGQTTATVTYDPNNDINFNLTDNPFFFRAAYEVTPTNSAGTADYSLTFYVSFAEANALATEYNNLIQGAPLSLADVLAAVRIYKGSTADPMMATSDAQVEFVGGTIAPYNGTDFQITTSANFTDFSQFRLAVVTAENALLPVELLAFTGTREGRAVRLDWSTATEQSSSHYLVARSQDGQTFEPLGRVEAAGFAQEETRYQLRDPQPLIGANHYRLQQVDLDGSLHNLGTVTVQVGAEAQLSLQRVYPNPTEGTLQVGFDLPQSQPVRLRVFNAQGQVVWQQQRDADLGSNEWTLHLEELAQGLYFFELQANGQAARGSFQKQ